MKLDGVRVPHFSAFTSPAGVVIRFIVREFCARSYFEIV